MYTHSGIQVTPGEGVPSLEDIAVALGRICRFAGNCRQFWPVLLHSMAVWELASVNNRSAQVHLFALLHDASEAVLGDITRPFKTADMKSIEKEIESKIYRSLGIEPPTLAMGRFIKYFDNRILYGEAHTVGPVGLETHFNEGTRTKMRKDVFAERCVNVLNEEYSVDDCIKSDGRAVKDYIKLVEKELEALNAT